jgi:uncharacterized protein CbrC (UPF0167 family)
MEAQVKALES